MPELTTQTTTQPKPFVFVLMPFHGEFEDIYKLGIKQTCDEAGAYCDRVDEQQFDGSILERIYNQISKADLLIADMTGRNPNVFYEVGYAHALGKRIILLTQSIDDIPFDLKHYPHIVYERRIIGLRQMLLSRLKWALEENSKGKSQFFNPTLVCRVSKVKIENNPEVLIRNEINRYGSFTVELSNSAEHHIQFRAFKVALILPEFFKNTQFSANPQFHDHIQSNEFFMENNEKIIILEDWFEMAPGEWQRFYGLTGGPENWNESAQCYLQIISQAEPPIKFPFRFRPDVNAPEF